MPQFPNIAAWRLENGSYCQICPLRGQRVVGSDGPTNAKLIAIAEAPGKVEVEWGLSYGEQYGRTLTGQLLPASLATELPPRPNSSWPRYALTGVFATSVIMCRPAHDKVESTQAQKAARCCANSLRAWLRLQLAHDPDRTIVGLGAMAMTFLRGTKSPIEPYRGRVVRHDGGESELMRALAPEPEADIIKDVLRGQHPTETWWSGIEWFLRKTLLSHRAALKKQLETPPVEAQAVCWFVGEIVKRQRAVLRKRAKEAT